VGAQTPPIAKSVPTESADYNRQMKLSQYLRNTLPEPCYDRPFVCNGLPQSCTVMIIGENPATQMQSDWWSFWNDETGFDLSRFETSYSEARIVAGKRPLTNTRRRLNKFRNAG